MNYKEIKAKLKEVGLDTQKLGVFASSGDCIMYDDESGDEIEHDVKGILEEHFGDVEVADTSYFHDGYECWVVYHFKEHDVYAKLTAYFSSYSDIEWNNISEVRPEEKTIIVYNDVKKTK